MAATRKEQKTAAQKQFYIFGEDPQTNELTLDSEFYGTLVNARKLFTDISDGNYRLLEDTSGLITKKTTTRTDVDVTFDPPRKRARKAKESKE